MAEERINILHVEDDPTILRLAKMTLEHAGFSVTSVGDPLKALDMDWKDINLALVDWLMPNVSGIELCHHARKQGYEGAILILSSKDLDRSERRLLEEVSAQFMAKPFGPQDLIGRVRECLVE